MRIKVIACEVLFREVCLCAARSPHIIDVEFLMRGLHDNPETLRAQLQGRIDAVEPGKYDAIVLGYGLCSNGVLGLEARDIPLVIPRAHDCITLFLGSKDVYYRHFEEQPGTYYYTSGWIERAGGGVPRTREEGEGLQMSYQEMVEKYGEDNAAYLAEVQRAWIARYSRAVFIDLKLGPRQKLRAEALRIARERKWDFRDLPGDLRLIRKMVNAEWEDEDFLVVQPGQHVVRGDETEIIAAQNADESQPPMNADER